MPRMAFFNPCAFRIFFPSLPLAPRYPPGTRSVYPALAGYALATIPLAPRYPPCGYARHTLGLSGFSRIRPRNQTNPLRPPSDTIHETHRVTIPSQISTRQSPLNCLLLVPIRHTMTHIRKIILGLPNPHHSLTSSIRFQKYLHPYAKQFTFTDNVMKKFFLSGFIADFSTIASFGQGSKERFTEDLSFFDRKCEFFCDNLKSRILSALD